MNGYVLKKKLGEGAYGKVRLAVKGKKEETFAIKVMKKMALKKRKEQIRDEKGSTFG